MQSRGKLFLIPNYLSPENDFQVLAPMVLDIVRHLKYYLSENIRNTRRFISSLDLSIQIEQLKMEVLDKGTSSSEMPGLMAPLLEGHDMGLMSEAGLPAIADPGKIAVAYAHANNIPVVPLPGSSSIMLALIASGFEGQTFTFHGYLPIDKAQRHIRIKKLEQDALRSGYTQIFMETPYRNMSLMDELLKTLHPETMLSVASDITAKNQFIVSKRTYDWQKTKYELHKKPSIFSIGGRL